jgi:23S rRNA (guanosine2251-2'-O)-methyltransferase
VETVSHEPNFPDRIYGVHPVLEALRSKARGFEAIHLQRGRRGREVDEILRLAKASRVSVLFEDREVLDRMAGTARHQGAVGIVAAKAYVQLDDLIETASRVESPLLLILDGIEDPHNLGAILRSAEAVGVQGIIIPERRAVGLTAVVAKASAGAVEHLPVARVVNLSQTIELLKAARFWVYGLDAKGDRNYLEVDYRGAVALVVGSEGRGLRALVAGRCDGTVRIPMQGKVESLNVSVATAVVLYEILRQRAGTNAFTRAAPG